MVRPSPMGVFVLISTPSFFIYLISLFKTSRGRRYSGMPYLSQPPGSGAASKITAL